MARQDCAVISARFDEPIHATAAPQAAWLLVEHRGPWGRDPLTDGRSIDPGVGGELKRRAAKAGVRVLLIRQHSPSPSRGHRYYLASSGSKPWLESAHCARFEEVLEVDLDALGAGRRPADGRDDHRPLYAVCTHGAKDPCCAQFGRPVVAALKVALRERVWECTHIGGDRFAATLLCLPHGLYFGRVTPPDVLRIANAYASGRIDLEHFRGRAGLDKSVQAADWHVRRQEGLLGIDDLQVGTRTADKDGTHEVELRSRQYRYQVRVRRVPDDEARPVGCGNDRLWTPSAWRLVEISRDPLPSQPVKAASSGAGLSAATWAPCASNA